MVETSKNSFFGAFLLGPLTGTGARSIFRLFNRSSRDFSSALINYDLNASTILNLAACTDGSTDPKNPTAIPNTNAMAISQGVTRKLNATSLKVVLFDVPAETKLSGSDNNTPIATPITAI